MNATGQLVWFCSYISRNMICPNLAHKYYLDRVAIANRYTKPMPMLWMDYREIMSIQTRSRLMVQLNPSDLTLIITELINSINILISFSYF